MSSSYGLHGSVYSVLTEPAQRTQQRNLMEDFTVLSTQFGSQELTPRTPSSEQQGTLSKVIQSFRIHDYEPSSRRRLWATWLICAMELLVVAWSFMLSLRLLTQQGSHSTLSSWDPRPYMPARRLQLSLLFLAFWGCLATPAYSDDLVTSVLTYREPTTYIAGNRKATFHNMNIHSTWLERVQCVDSDSLQDAIVLTTSYRCDWGSGKPIDPDKPMSESIHEWGGWSRDQRRMFLEAGSHKVYQCSSDRNGHDYGCMSFDVVHCAFAVPHNSSRGMSVSTRTTLDVTVDELDNGFKHKFPFKFGDSILRVGETSFPDAVIISDGRAYPEDTTLAHALISARCPIYRSRAPDGTSGLWKIDKSLLKLSYNVDGTWTVEAPWLGRPTGLTVPVSDLGNGKYETNVPMSTAILYSEGGISNEIYSSEEIDDSCQIQGCFITEGIAVIDIKSSRVGWGVHMLVTPSRHNATTCRVYDSMNATIMVPVMTGLVSINDRSLRTLASSVECPPPSQNLLDQMYSHTLDRHSAAQRDSGHLSIDTILGSIKIPTLNYAKYSLYACAAAVAVMTRFNQAGVVVSALLVLLANFQGASALEIHPQAEQRILITTMALHWINPWKFMMLVSSAVFLCMYKRKQDWEIGIAVMSIICYYITDLHWPGYSWLSLTAVVAVMESDWLMWYMKDVIHSGNEFIEQWSVQGSLPRWVDIKEHARFGNPFVVTELGIVMHPPREWSVLTTSEQLTTKPSNVVEATIHNQRIKATFHNRKVARVSASSMFYPKGQAERIETKKNVRNMKNHIFYENEYYAMKRWLKQLDETDIHAIYAQAPRIHGRLIWDLAKVGALLKKRNPNLWSKMILDIHQYIRNNPFQYD